MTGNAFKRWKLLPFGAFGDRGGSLRGGIGSAPPRRFRFRFPISGAGGAQNCALVEAKRSLSEKSGALVEARRSLSNPEELWRSKVVLSFRRNVHF